jgi:hypothetical protein
VLTDGHIFNRSISVFPEFDRRQPRLYPLAVAHRTRKSVLLSPEVIEAAQQRGLALGDYVQQLHQNQRSSRIAYAASLYRGFALLEMARVPIDPAYFDLVDGCMNAEESLAFRVLAGSGEDHALVRAAVARRRHTPLSRAGRAARGAARAGAARGLHRGGAPARGHVLPLNF